MELSKTSRIGDRNMCRFVDAGTSILRKRTVWLPLLAWVILTPLLHWLIPPTPVHRFDFSDAARDLDEERHPLPTPRSVVGIFSDGGTIVTATGSSRKTIRFWDIRSSGLRHEMETAGLNPHWLRGTLSSNNQWLGFSNIHTQIPWIEICNTRTGEIPHRLPASEAVFSSSGDRVAYLEETLHLLDLNTGSRRAISLLEKDSAQTKYLSMSPLGFSKDDRYLAGVKNGQIGVFDLETGAIAAVLPVRADGERDYPYQIAFAADGQALAWENMEGVVVADFANKNRCTFSKARLIGWLPTGRLLIGATQTDLLHRRRVSALESWDWREKRKVASWKSPLYGKWVPARRLSWAYHEPQFHVRLSPDGKHVLFAGHIERPAYPALISKLLTWLNVSEPPPLLIDLTVLDAEKLVANESWRIPADYDRHIEFQFTGDSRTIIYSDWHVVELWPLPPRSWLTSALWAGLAPLLIIGTLSLARCWPKRKRATITPPLPPASVPEVSHAKT
jgi:hypothetical protein